MNINWIQESKRQREKEKQIWEDCQIKIAQSDKILPEHNFVSIYPKGRKSKPTGEDGLITQGLKLFTTVLPLEELKVEVAQKGKTFSGCIFLDLDYYKETYGKCTALKRLKESGKALHTIYHKEIRTPFSQLPCETTTGGNVKNTQEYFIMMTTFRT